MGDNDLCIGHIQHTQAEVIVEQMGSAHHSGDAELMQPFRNYLLERTA